MTQESEWVEDEETLYRRVRAGRRLYQIGDDGLVKFEPSAFSERNMRPSVDRARLCNANPWHTKYEPTDGVTSVVAVDVRQLEPLPQLDSKKRPITGKVFQADVEPKRIDGNDAHAEIFLHPTCNSRGVFDRLCTRLAYLAEQQQWAAPPESAAATTES
jgi:hypothetical protein